MKKILIAVLAVASLSLTGCNEQIFDTKWNFNKAHLVSANKCVEVKSWKNFDDGDMVQVTLQDGTTLLGHSNEIVLINSTCPYCHH